MIFHDIVLGRSTCSPLKVAFCTRANFRKEAIHFEGINFKSPFHVNFVRLLVFANFMARPCYTKVMKMPGPKGIITIAHNLQKAVFLQRAYINIMEIPITPSLNNNALP
jgi:hypothetical protein